METLSCLWVARASNDGQSDAIFSFLTYTRPGRKMGRSRATNVIIAHATMYDKHIYHIFTKCSNISDCYYDVTLLVKMCQICVSMLML